MQLDKQTPVIMGQVNRANVLHFIKEYGPISRANVARHLNMSRSTISSIVDQLINEGRVREGATGESTSLGGRKPIFLHYVPSARYALGVDIGGTFTIVILSDLEGHVVARHKFPSNASSTKAMAGILDEIQKFIRQSGVNPSLIVGTGIGFPGVADHRKGVIVKAPGLKLTNFDARRFFESLPGDVWIDNDVNMAVIGERWKGVAQGHNHVALVAIGTGIGAGLILNGKLFRGRAGYAGEVGHLHIDAFTTSPKLDLDDYGPLEQRSSGKGIEERAKERAPHFPNSALNTGEITAPRVFEASEQGDVLAAQIIQEALSYLCFSVANIVTLLNPDVLIVGGGLSRRGESWRRAVEEGVSRLSPVPCEIVLAGLGEDAAAYGSCATALLNADELRLSGIR